MYGVKGTSTLINTVSKQGVLTKQFTAPKTTAFLSNLPARQVSAGKLSYTTSRASQFGQKQSNNEQDSNSHFQQKRNHWNVAGLKHHQFRSNSTLAAISPESEEITALVDSRIRKAAMAKNPKAVVAEFVQGKSAGAELSTQNYEAVIEAYGRLRKHNQPLTPMLDAYQDMVASGVRPTSQTYALLIRSLVNRDSEVQKTVSVLRRQIARTGNEVDNLGELEAENNMGQAVALFNKAVNEKQTQDFDIDLYNRLLRGLSFKGNTTDGLYIYEHLEKAHNTNPNGSTFAALMALFGSAGDLNAVQECFKEYKSLAKKLPHHDAAYVYNALVYAHVNAGDIAGALNVVENVMVKDKVNVTIIPYNKIIRNACYVGNMEAVDNIIKKLESDGSLPKPDVNTYGILLSTYARMENFEQASKMYHSMLNLDLSKQYGHLANYVYACTGKKMADEAYSTVTAMREHGLELDANLCKNVVLAFVESNRMSDAVEALNSLVSLHAKSTFVDENSPLAALALDLTLKCNNLTSAVSILQTLNMYSIRPTPTVSAAVLQMYHDVRADANQWKQVSANLNSQSFQTLYEATFRRENAPDLFCKTALDLLKDMHTLGLTLPASLYVRVSGRMKKYANPAAEASWKEEFAPYLSAINEQIKNDQELDKQVKNNSTTESTGTPSINLESDMISGDALKIAIGGNFDEALDVLNSKIIQKGKVPTPEVIRDMIQLSTKVGRLDAAENIFKTVSGSFSRLDRHQKNRSVYMVYNAMLVAYARNSDLENAKVFYDKLRKHGLYPDGDAYGSLLACTANATTDESIDALAIYEEAKKHNVRPTVYFYNVIISKLSKCRKIEPVLQLFEEMKHLGIAPNSITYASVISTCVRCSSESRAARFFQEMISSPKYQPRIGVYNSMIQFYVQQRPNREKALEYFNLSKNFNLKPSHHTYKLLIEAYANIPAYDMLAAHKLLSEMYKRHGLKPTAIHYATLIRSYGCLHRDVKSAFAVYKEMKKAGIKADETVYQAILNTYIDNNDMKNAETLYKDMLSEGTHSSPYIENLFITGYGNQGDVVKAEQVFNKMSDAKAKKDDIVREPSTYEAMVQAYVSNKQEGKASDIIELMRTRDFPPKVVDGVAQLIHNSSN
jgi:pentatricopeptide repeat protein